MVVKLKYRIPDELEDTMFNKISIISAIVLMVLGIMGIGVFVAMFIFGEGVGKFVPALIVSLILVIVSVLDMTVFRVKLSKIDNKNKSTDEVEK
jgi:cation transporter-like permease